jgi:BirA family biotin operon repressor/biotin-[acetyl-CoA-carboxylase] ligase
MNKGNNAYIENLLSKLESLRLGRDIVYFDEISSTNETAKQLAKDGRVNGTTVISDSQSGGRGRRGRVWSSEKGAGIYMSIIIRPNITAETAPRFTLAAAMGVCDALNCFDIKTKIKWPNDLLYDNRKLCGILMEAGGTQNGIDYIVIGIGVNVNNKMFPKEIDSSAVSMANIAGKDFDRGFVAAEILNCLEKRFSECERDESFFDLLSQYKLRSCVYGQKVRITGTSEEYEGVAEDFDPLGRIWLRLCDGTRTAVGAGEVTLRRITE